MSRLQGMVLTPSGFMDGALVLGVDGRIVAVEGEPVADVQALGAPRLLLPGFVDLHVHGAAGYDIMDGGEAVQHIARVHARHGTTSMLATTMTAPAEDLQHAFAAIANGIVQRPAGGARVLGVHLEGPFISDGRLGAQPPFARPAALDEISALHRLAPIRVITLAPEVPGNMELISSLCAAGFRVQIGHSGGSYEDGVKALACGAGSFTHLFNAMTGLHHRAPGMAGAALAHAQFAELIPDLLHVHPGAMRVALRAIPYLYCVSDSTAATGMPDGAYQLGRQTVYKCRGGVRLADGSLAGSTLTLDLALRNLVRTVGLSIREASARVSTFAADYLGLTDRGRLQPGAWGDVVVLDADLQPQEIYLEGSRLVDSDAA